MAEKIWSQRPIELWVANIDEIDFLENNPRYMKRDMFRRLVENIRHDKALQSVPFCIKNGDRFKVVSGNHRIKAAKEAGVEQIIVMIPDREITKDREKAIALSHNAIDGEDDPLLLKKMYEEIEELDEKLYAGIDMDKIKQILGKVELDNFSGIRIDYVPVNLLFLPEEIGLIESVLEDVEQMFWRDETFVLKMKDYEKFLKIISQTAKRLKLKNNSAILMWLVEYAWEKLSEEIQTKRQ